MKKILSILLVLCLASCCFGTDWYVRPRTGEYGAENGTSYATAWDGVTAITWGGGGVEAGDTLYIAGIFDQTGEETTIILNVTVSGTSGNVITIRGDYPGDPGILVGAKRISAWNDNGDGSFYVTHSSLAPSAFEYSAAVGIDDVVLKPVATQALVASTDGSHLRRRYSISAFSDLGGGEVQADLTANYDFSNGDSVRIYATTNYNGTFVITSIDADSFKFTDTWNGDDAIGICTDDIFWYNPHGGTELTVYTSWVRCITLNGNDYITIQNLICYCGGSSGGIIQFEKKTDGPIAEYITVDNCTLKYAETEAIRNDRRGGNYIITNNTITEFTSGIYIHHDGIGSSGDTSGSPDNVTISGNYLDCGEGGYNSYWMKNRGAQDRAAIAGQPGDNWTISDNHIARAVDCGMVFFRYITAGHEMRNMHILRNRIDIVHDPSDAYESCGIYLAGGNGEGAGDKEAGMIIAYNIIQNCYEDSPTTGDGIGISVKSGNVTNPADRPLITNNIIVGCDTSFKIYGHTTPPEEKYLEMVFKNNISYNPRGDHLVIPPANGYDLDMSNNLWYPDTAAGDYEFLWENVASDNFADFISDADGAGVTLGGNSVVDDPLFVDTTNDNFQLTTSSPAKDAGVDVGLRHDFRGGIIPFNTTPDIGAYEFGTAVYLLF